MKKVGVLFDLDGVLINSEDLYTEFWEEIEKIYPTNIKDFAFIIKGNALFKILNTYFPQEIHQDIINRVHDFENNIKYPIYDGVIEFLELLKKQGFPTAIVTSSDDVKMNALYKEYPYFRQYFDIVITGSDVTESKPHPQGYLMAADKIGCASTDCYVFEDSIQGIAAGIAAGATVVALTTSNPIDLLKDKAHAVIDSFVDFNIEKMLNVKKSTSFKTHI